MASGAQSAQSMSAGLALCSRCAGLLRAAPAHAMALARRHARGDQLLRHGGTQDDARARWSISTASMPRRDALQRRCRQCRHRQFRLFRHHDAHDRAGARHGERRAAAGLSRRSRSTASTTGTAASSPTRRCDGWSRASRSRTRSPSRSISGARAATFPRNMAEVTTRQKEIQYSSRTRADTDRFKRCSGCATRSRELLEKLPPELSGQPRGRRAAPALPSARSTTSSSSSIARQELRGRLQGLRVLAR